MRERYKVVAVVIIIILIISIANISLIPKKNDRIGLTGLEGLRKAEKIAINWSDEALLYHARPYNYTVNGTEHRWLYQFFRPSSVENYTHSSYSPLYAEWNGYQYDTLWVLVCSNGTTYNTTDKQAFREHLTPIINWKIDTDKAYKIATSDGFSDFIEENTDKTGENLTKIRHTEEYTSIGYDYDNQLTINIGISIIFWSWDRDYYYWNVSAENGKILNTNFIENRY